MLEETDGRCSDSEGEADLQGAVAAVEVIQARRVDELLVHSTQRLHRGQKTRVVNLPEDRRNVSSSKTWFAWFMIRHSAAVTGSQRLMLGLTAGWVSVRHSSKSSRASGSTPSSEHRTFTSAGWCFSAWGGKTRPLLFLKSLDLKTFVVVYNLRWYKT